MLDVEHAKRFIAELAEENRSFYGSPRGRGALKDLQQSFPHPWIYVAELLQNAVDAGASSIWFEEPTPGVLVLEHNGKAFDECDVEGICTKGVSAKGAGTVGFMGVGFKAVFRSFETVTISSGPWRFRLQAKINTGEEYGDQQRDWMGAVIPIWHGEIPSPSLGMTCRFELQDRIEGLKSIRGDFEAVFRQDNALMALLATRDVKAVKLFGTTWLLSVEEHKKEGISVRCRIQALDDVTDNLRQWMLFRREYEPSREAVRRFLEHRAINPSPEEKEKAYSDAARPRRVELFFPLDEEGFPALPEQGEAFALLPTGQQLPIGAHINADWLLTVTRMEFMDIEETHDGDGNQWQKEIRSQIPSLIKGYLEWLGSDESPSKGTWEIAYRIFPKATSSQERFGNWVLGGDFISRIGELVNSVPFLPSLTGKEGTSNFLTPLEGRILPHPLANGFENKPELCAWELFGEKIVSTSVLGARARNCLVEFGILKQLSPQELQASWGKTKVGEWYDGFPEKDRFSALFKLVKAFSEIEDDAWIRSNLVFLPTEGSNWISPKEALRLPSDWGIIVNEAEIVQMLLPYIGEADHILNRQFDNYVQNQRWNFWEEEYKIARRDFGNVVSNWWANLPERNLSGSDLDNIVKFTCWVQAKQTNRRSLIHKLLAKAVDDGNMLLPCDKTLLEFPYAGEFRRVFFPDLPCVLSHYYNQSSKDADWKTFLESGPSTPQGKFNVYVTSRQLGASSAHEYLNEKPPSRRSSLLNLCWPVAPSIQVSNKKYVIVTFSLREDVYKKLMAGADTNYLRAFAQWMEETPGPLKAYANERLLYIPYGSSQIQERTLDKPAHFKTQLTECRWVIAKDGTGPYRPAEVLKEIDRVRPEAKVADLSVGLIKVLEQAGINFGQGVPNAEALRRLQFEGPTANLDTLAKLLESAIADLNGDEDKTQELKQILDKTALFPVPPGQQLLDGGRRVPGSRCVLQAGYGHRSDLSWVVAVESFENGSIEGRIINSAKKLYNIPARTSATHCMDFLEWVWDNQPEADKVRHMLPRAYSYLSEDLAGDSIKRERWLILHKKARVYTLGRRWAQVHGVGPVYYDDIGTVSLSEIVPRTQIATPGHLGLRVDDGLFPEGVTLLGLPLLSSRYMLRRIEGKTMPVPSHWQNRFKNLQELLLQVATRRESSVSIATKEDVDPPNIRQLSVPLGLRSVSGIARVIEDLHTGMEVRQIKSWAEVFGQTAVVAGSPSDFAVGLCQILIKHFRLNSGEDSSLASEITVLIVLLDSDDFEKHMRALQIRFGILEEGEGGEGEEEETTPSGEKDSVEVESSGAKDKIGKGGTGETTEKMGGGRKSEDSGERGENGGGEKEPSGKAYPRTSREEESSRGGSGSYTAEDRERKIRGLFKRIDELRAVGMVNDVPDERKKEETGESQVDERYRNAVVVYEKAKGRYADAKDPFQEGHDIDSFTDPPGVPGRKLTRRIEVKGRRHPWEGEETVELSRPQFKEAFQQMVEEAIDLAPDFDHWVYVVEEVNEDRFRVLPTRNPAQGSSKFELRGGTWRHFVEEEAEVSGREVQVIATDTSPRRRSILDLREETPTADENDSKSGDRE